MTEQDRSMITLVATRAKHAGTGTIKVCKQCSMRSRYAVKHGSSTRVNLLRPKPAPPTYIERLCEPHGEDGKVRGLRFVQAEKFEQLWQNAIQGNSKSEPTCTGTSSLTKTARDRWASAGRNASNATLVAICQKEKSYTMKWTGVEEVVK